MTNRLGKTAFSTPFSALLTRTLCLFLLALAIPMTLITARAQTTRSLTPSQQLIEKQRERLSSSSHEDRRDAVMRLGAMRLPAASRAVLPALSDASPMIRAVAASAIYWLPAEERVSSLLPLLNDKDEFVRREAAYALGHTHSRSATSPLVERLLNDKEDSVRGAAAVALGEIADDAALIPLANVLAPEIAGSAHGKIKREKNPFVLRSAAIALGVIRSRAATPALIAALSNEKLESDIRREAARSLGMIADPEAMAALRTAVQGADPYLSNVAYEALKKLRH